MHEAATLLRTCVLLVAALASGCTSTGLFGRADAPDDLDTEDSFAVDDALDAQGLAVYLELMRTLVEGDAVAQTDAFIEVAEAAAAAPTTTNRLKLALALATPGHPASDAADAQRMLRDLLATGARLLPEEHMLVSIHLEEVEQRLILDSQAERAREQTAVALAEQDTENSRRLEAALAENAELRQQLEEAQQKLNAITNIERSIRERENGADPQ